MSKNVDVLFVYTNINAYHSDTYSFGLGYLAGVLKANGFNPVLGIVSFKKDYRKLLETIIKHKPKIIGFTAVSSQFVFVAELAKMIKSVHNCVIVCGGVHPTIAPECLLSAPDFDGFFIGESEFSFLDFTLAVTNGDQFKHIDNFCYVENGKLVMNKLRAKVADLGVLPYPDREMYDYQSIIDNNDGVIAIMAGRGCPYHCTYCSNHAIARVYGTKSNSVRFNKVDSVINEIEMLKSKYRFQKIWFEDDLFILNRAWLDEFLTKYKSRFNFPFMCQIRPNICSKEVLHKLKEAGCYKIFLAVESANDHIRNVVMKRNITKEQLENTFKYAKEIGIETLSINIIGVPGETEETILETINFNKRMNPTITGVNLYSPYEGTIMGDLCKSEGLIKKTNPRLFLDRRQSVLRLPTISNKKLMYYYDNFAYLVYKDMDAAKAKRYLYDNRYRKWRSHFIVRMLFNAAKRVKFLNKLGKKILAS